MSRYHYSAGLKFPFIALFALFCLIMPLFSVYATEDERPRRGLFDFYKTHIGAGVSLNLSNFSGSDAEGFEWVTNPGLQIQLSQRIHPRFALSTSLHAAPAAGKRFFSEEEVSGIPDLDEESELNYEFSALNLSLSLSFDMLRLQFADIYLTLGPYLSWFTSHTVSISDSRGTQEFDISDNFTNSDYGLKSVLGIHIPVARNHQLFSEILSYTGANNLFDSRMGEMRNIRFSLSAGYRYRIF
jgi:hypothetical protein